MISNRYNLLKQIGEGGFGEVWLAKDLVTGQQVALKLYKITNKGHLELVREYNQVSGLNSDNLIKVFHVDRDEAHGISYLVMEYCPYGSVEELIGEMDEDEIWRCIHDIAAGLVALSNHTIYDAKLGRDIPAPVIHQDIKPANILIRKHDKEGHNVYVIADFGISKTTISQKSGSTLFSSAGTLAYMAPERFSPTYRPQVESDIWSLGAMLYELVEGRLPFPNTDGLCGGNWLNQQGVTLPQMQNGNISPKLCNVISHCLAKNPLNRPTARHLYEMATKHRIPHNNHQQLQCNLSTDDTRIQTQTHPIPQVSRPSNAKNTIPLKSKHKPIIKWWPFALSAVLSVALLWLLADRPKYVSETNTDDTEYEESPVFSDDYDTTIAEVLDEEEEDSCPDAELMDENQETTIFKTKTFSYTVTTACGYTATFKMEYPIQGPPALIQNIREWIIEQIAMAYKGDLSNPELLVEYCKTKDRIDDDGASETDIKIEYENDKVITIVDNSGYQIYGAVSGSWCVQGATFRKSDGKRFSPLNMSLYLSDLQPIIKSKLKEYFEVTTDEELKNMLFLEEPYNINNIPLPKDNEPWITANGVTFHYDKYEIAAGAYAVSITIPFDKLRKYVSNSTATTFF